MGFDVAWWDCLVEVGYDEHVWGDLAGCEASLHLWEMGSVADAE